jgi:hypothetical protein
MMIDIIGLMVAVLETAIVCAILMGAGIFFIVPLFWICLGWWLDHDIPFSGPAKKKNLMHNGGL